MVVREPGLLTADFNEIMRRLVEMKVRAHAVGVWV
jgi:hypothetical protein